MVVSRAYVILGLMAAGCGDATPVIDIESCEAGPCTPRPRRDGGPGPIPLPDGGPTTGHASPEDRSIDFGTVGIGEQQTLAIRLRGDPARASQVRVVALDGAAFHPLGFELGQPIIIPAGRSRNLDLAFRPTIEGSYAADLHIQLCADGCDDHFSLRGVGATTELSCSQQGTLGGAVVGGCLLAGVVCTNPTLAPIEIPFMIIEPETSAFIVRQSRVVVAPQQQLPVDVSFCPTEEREYTADLVIGARKRNGDIERLTIPLAGTGLRDTSGCALQQVNPVIFAPTLPGQQLLASFDLVNLGPGPCVLVQPPSFFSPVFTVDPLPPEVPSGATIVVQVAFRPSEPGYFEAELIATFFGGILFDFHIPIRGIAPADGTSGYAVTRTENVPLDPPRGDSVTFSNSDDGLLRIDLPFAFPFDGVPARAITVTTNGWVSFENVAAAPPRNREAFPDPFGDNALVALWWDDLFPGMALSSAFIGTFTTGMPPARVFHVRYNQVPFFSGNVGQNIDCELRIHEDGSLELHYGVFSGPDSVPSAFLSAAVGWEGFGGVVGEALLPCSPRCAAADWPTNTILRLDPR